MMKEGKIFITIIK